MKKIAILASHIYFDNNSQGILTDMSLSQFDLLSNAFAKYNIYLEIAFWEDIGNNWANYDAIIAISAWNYPQNLDRFIECLNEISQSGTVIFNPIEIIKDNFDKNYLTRLANLGANVPKTIEINIKETNEILNAFDVFECDEIIIKPAIGAGAWRQSRLKRGEKLPCPENLPKDRALIQPFLKSVAEQGELSLLFFNGEFSHGLIKRPQTGDYRTQTKWGATEFNISPPIEAINSAINIMKIAYPNIVLPYARIDMVQSDNGEWLLMEIELIEPYLYLPFDGHDGLMASDNFAKAIANMI